MRVIGLAGWSGAGKTTLVARLIPELRRRGMSVSTLKHAHHAFDIDQPGKDSHTHREAGATEVLVASSRRYAIVHELRDEPEPPLAQLLGRLSPVDLVVVEGFKREPHPKIEVHRTANGRPFLFPEFPGIVALATDAEAPPGLPVPAMHLDDVPAIAEAATAHALPLPEVLARLAAEPSPA
ncbi:molybdopterin-guanine dinucleotide biosynthesis protein B [Enterovirga aerilata]|uniref:Molybdopterin-guanine dinucleotide biosynthesis protein B n=1 Tax=Enterovirga aerilata TaxID=2730920 RepID=A0A849I7E7_9HYPH|nr:molybdopterin-guanine dinucleotide biosynthesis protein B [Enterovirga sp. DB1703]NNM72225.1 molybdopterin-guanine dinucleotide biosynthesis protein B [Enterovirga sp. DB1703]